MIKKKHILVLFALLGIFGCQNKPSISVTEVMESKGLDTKGQTKWINKDASMTFTSFENKESGAYLGIVTTQVGDTLLKHIGQDLVKVKNLYKNNGNYFLKLTEGKPAKVKFFRVDTLVQKAYAMEYPSMEDLTFQFQDHLVLQGEFTVLSGSSLDRIGIQRDSSGHLVKYVSDVRFEPIKEGNKYLLAAHFESTTTYVFDEDGRSRYQMEIGRTDGGRFIGAVSSTRHNVIDGSKTLESVEFVRQDLSGETTSITELESKVLFETEKTSEFHPDMFRYNNGAYFISTSLPYVDNFEGEYPVVMHLDTAMWSLHKVVPLRSDESFHRVDPVMAIKYLSGDTKRRVSFFHETFEIVRVESGYRLKKKKLI